ncbi:MAG: isoleucine--tRNA ligase [Candidatus Rhabdochlamydia sp.]
MFELGGKESFSEKELKILDFWEKEGIFQKSLDQTCEGPLFSFYDGPPFATGLPHYGHLLAGTIKDVVPRFWTMRGYHAKRRFGWDCHGLPVENEIEKAQNLSGAPEIEQFGIANFNEECRSIVLRYTHEWKSTVTRMGRWVDFDSTYHTMDKSFMESVWWVFGQLYQKGLVYEGLKVMPFSAKLGTPLSNFEANLNYKDVDDPSLVITFALKQMPDVSLLVWTTTPWTLPSNLALAVHPEFDYVKIHDLETKKNYILAEARLKTHFKQYEILEKFKGKMLQGMHYEPLFSYFTSSYPHGFKILTDEFVSMEDGTGVVHMAPAFGEADFFICQKEGIDPICPVDQNGKFTSQVPDYAGVFVKDADKEIIKALKQQGRVFLHTQIRHRYPFCWRSDTPLLYKAVTTWFVGVESLKERLLKANEQIDWVPGHIKEGRFGKWLENARDWAISRNRYWGTPIPIWRSEDGEIVVISSVAELEEKVGQQVLDLHRHFIDDLTFTQGGKVFRRIPEVFDCWFESGSMPYAQNHYPFDNQDATLKAFPADFIGEGLDQTRGWFYTLTVLSVALFDKPAFKHVIVNGIILAEDGAKMSKRLKNYPEPHLVIDQFGADAVRLYLLNSPAVAADDLRFSSRGVELIVRQALIPLWNCYVFLATYANIYHFKPEDKAFEPAADIDQWILSELQLLIQEVRSAMECYLLQKAVAPVMQFIDKLTDWYIRRSRERFWQDEATLDRQEAFQTLYTVLLTVVKVLAPFAPFISEAIYQSLKQPHDPLSVHLCSFPEVNEPLRNQELEMEMMKVQQIVSLGHSLRKEHQLKVRQPLATAHIVCANPEVLEAVKRQKELIQDELNVKQIEFHEEESQFVILKAKPHFRILGKKVGPLMNAVQMEIQKLSLESLQKVLNHQTVEITVEGVVIVLTSEDIAVEREVKPGVIALTENELTIALDTTLSEDLILEGIARELINRINTLRRDKEFAVTDRIDMTIQADDVIIQAFKAHQDYICHETLLVQVTFMPCLGDLVEINGIQAWMDLKKREVK